jgi:hypothetical protein
MGACQEVLALIDAFARRGQNGLSRYQCGAAAGILAYQADAMRVVVLPEDDEAVSSVADAKENRYQRLASVDERSVVAFHLFEILS